LNRSIIKFLKIAIPLGIGIFLIYYSYSRFTSEQLDEIGEYFKQADYTFIALAVLISLISHISRAYRWNYMLEPLGYKPRFLNNFMAVSVAYIMNIFIPKSGEISRAVVINKYENVPFDNALGTIISERAIDVVFLMIYTAIALMFQFDALYNYMIELIDPSKFYLGIGGLIMIMIIFFLFMKISNSGLRKKIKQFYLGLKDGVLSVLHMKKTRAYLAHSILIWGLYLLSFMISMQALEETSNIEFGIILITFVVGSFSFAFTNSGFGSYPFFVAGILAVFAIPETVGTAIGWIIWMSNIASIILLGGLSFIFLPFYNNAINEDS